MVRVMVPPLATLVAGVNTRTGATALPETSVDRVMDVKFVILDMIAAASLPAVKAASALDDILKPAVVAAWAAPRVSPVSGHGNRCSAGRVACSREHDGGACGTRGSARSSRQISYGRLQWSRPFPRSSLAGMVRVMVPPLATLVAGVNTRTGATALPETSVDRVMDAKLVILDMIAAASLPAVKAASALDDILKPAVVAA